jgi:hypothetical protein
MRSYKVKVVQAVLLTSVGSLIVLGSYLLWVFAVAPFRQALSANEISLKFPEDASGLYTIHLKGAGSNHYKRFVVVDFSEARSVAIDEDVMIFSKFKLSARYLSGRPLPLGHSNRIAADHLAVWLLPSTSHSVRHVFVGTQEEFSQFMSSTGKQLLDAS